MLSSKAPTEEIIKKLRTDQVQKNLIAQKQKQKQAEIVLVSQVAEVPAAEEEPYMIVE